jgi:hypothetical protein
MIYRAGIIIHFAYALMKYSHIKNLEKPIEQSRIYLLDQRWWICFIFYFVGLVFTFIALYFVQLSLVASLSCLGIWFAFRYTSWYQAEKVFFKHQLSFTFVVIGTLLFLLFSTKKNTHMSEASLGNVFANSLNPAQNTFQVLFFLLVLLLSLVSIILSYARKFQNVFISDTAPSTLLVLSMVIAKIFPGISAFFFSIIPLLLHIHFLQRTLAAYSYFVWISFNQFMVLFFSLTFGEIMFNEFPESIVQCLLLFCAWVCQIVGLFALTNDKVNKVNIYPDRSQLYMRYNEMVYEFDSDEGSNFELNATMESDTEDEDTKTESSPATNTAETAPEVNTENGTAKATTTTIITEQKPPSGSNHNDGNNNNNNNNNTNGII